MTKQEVTQAVAMAKENREYNLAVKTADIVHNTEGRVYLPIEAIAALLNYQAMQLNGELDLDELNQTVAWLKNKVLII